MVTRADLGNGQLQDTLFGTSRPPSTVGAQMAFRDEKETSKDQVGMVGGRMTLTALSSTTSVGYTNGTWSKPYDYNSTFDFHPGGRSHHVQPDGTRPHAALHDCGLDYLDPTNYAFSGFSNSTANNFDKEHSVVVNLEVPLHWSGFDKESVKDRSQRPPETQANDQCAYSYPNLPNLLLSDVAQGSPRPITPGSIRIPLTSVRATCSRFSGRERSRLATRRAVCRQYLDAKEDVYAAYVQYEMGPGRSGSSVGCALKGPRIP